MGPLHTDNAPGLGVLQTGRRRHAQAHSDMLWASSDPKGHLERVWSQGSLQVRQTGGKCPGWGGCVAPRKFPSLSGP